MREHDLTEQIKKAVSLGKVKEPFRASDFPFLKKGSKSFLPKHAKDNPGGYTGYFIRVSRGAYRLL